MLTKEQKERIRKVYATDVWHNNQRMVDYCTNKTAVLIEFPNGEFIPIEKRSIDKDFCFGESGYDYDDAASMAHVARTSESYFMQENMKWVKDYLDSIEEQYDMFSDSPSLPRFVLTISEHVYSGQPDTSPLKGIQFIRDGELLGALGGSAFVRELPGTRFTYWDNPRRVPTRDELDAIKAGYEQAAKEHEKKVNTYLKKYGLSKVHSWTYWRDA